MGEVSYLLDRKGHKTGYYQLPVNVFCSTLVKIFTYSKLMLLRLVYNSVGQSVLMLNLIHCH